MKHKTLALIVFCLAAAIAARAQDNGAKKIDEIESMCCEQTVAQLDNYLVELQNDPEAKGYIIFYGGRAHPGCMSRGRFPRRKELGLLITALEQHVKFRKFPLERIVWINGGYKESWVVELWKTPKGGAPPVPTPVLRKKDIKYKKGTPYNIGWGCDG